MKTTCLSALFALLSLASAAQAGWSFTAKTYTSGCVGGAPTYTIPFPSSGLPTRSACESTRAQILAIRVSASNGYGGTCTVGYTCTPCTGFDDPKSGAGEAGGTFNASGSVQGRANFASNNNTEAKDWEQETRDRLERLGKSTLQQAMVAPSTGDAAFDQGYQQQMQEAYGGEEFMPKKKPRKVPARGSSAWRSQQGTTYEAGDERTTEDEAVNFRAAGTDEAAQAQSQGGIGLTQGAPDKTPPPSPEKPQSKNRSGARCRDRNWWYSSKTGNCYYSKESCEAAALHQGTCEQSL